MLKPCVDMDAREHYLRGMMLLTVDLLYEEA